MKAFNLIAHRGMSTLAPESTIAAFDLALEHGFPHFETDVQLTKDGVPIILHDESLGRTISFDSISEPGSDESSIRQRRVDDCTWSELESLSAGRWFGPEWEHCKVSTLGDLLARYQGRIHLHLVGTCCLASCVQVCFTTVLTTLYAC